MSGGSEEAAGVVEGAVKATLGWVGWGRSAGGERFGAGGAAGGGEAVADGWVERVEGLGAPEGGDGAGDVAGEEGGVGDIGFEPGVVDAALKGDGAPGRGGVAEEGEGGGLVGL